MASRMSRKEERNLRVENGINTAWLRQKIGNVMRN